MYLASRRLSSFVSNRSYGLSKNHGSYTDGTEDRTWDWSYGQEDEFYGYRLRLRTIYAQSFLYGYGIQSFFCVF